MRAAARALVLATLAAAPALLGGVAAAAPAGPAAPAVRHCVAAVRPAGTGPMSCFASFRAAIAFASAGRVTNAPQSATEAAGDPAFTAALNRLAVAPAGAVTPAASVVAGVE